MEFWFFIFLIIMIQLAYSSSKEEKWVNINAKIFVPGQDPHHKNETEKKTKISLAENFLNDGRVKNNDMVAKYLLNADLYYLVQASKIISNAVHDFIKKREKEQKEKEQKLKEHFLYDFNTFIDNAHIACLDYLEIEIPEKVLNSFVCAGIFNNCPSIWINRSYHNVAEPPRIIIQGFEFPDDPSIHHYQSTLHRKQYQLKENETVKFKFHFRPNLKILENHHITFFGQTFGFQDLYFTLFRPGGKTFKFRADSRRPNLFLNHYLYHKTNNFKSNAKFRVKMVEETGVKFKFKFHTFQTTDKYYTFHNPTYNYDNLFPNFKNYFSSTKQKYDLPYFDDFLNPHYFYDMNEQTLNDPHFGQHHEYQNHNFGQQQQQYQNHNFGQF